MHSITKILLTQLSFGIGGGGFLFSCTNTLLTKLPNKLTQFYIICLVVQCTFRCFFTGRTAVCIFYNEGRWVRENFSFQNNFSKLDFATHNFVFCLCLQNLVELNGIIQDFATIVDVSISINS